MRNYEYWTDHDGRRWTATLRDSVCGSDWQLFDVTIYCESDPDAVITRVMQESVRRWAFRVIERLGDRNALGAVAIDRYAWAGDLLSIVALDCLADGQPLPAGDGRRVEWAR